MARCLATPASATRPLTHIHPLWGPGESLEFKSSRFLQKLWWTHPKEAVCPEDSPGPRLEAQVHLLPVATTLSVPTRAAGMMPWPSTTWTWRPGQLAHEKLPVGLRVPEWWNSLRKSLTEIKTYEDIYAGRTGSFLIICFYIIYNLFLSGSCASCT